MAKDLSKRSRYKHEDPIDNFWAVGGLPSCKLNELERNWQMDMERLMVMKESDHKEALQKMSKELNATLATEKQLKDIYETQNAELQRRIVLLKAEAEERAVETRLREKEKEVEYKKQLKIEAHRMKEKFEVEKRHALEEQRENFLLELKARDREIDKAFSQHMKTTVAHMKQEHEHNLNFRLSQLQAEGDKQIEELTEALREALRGGTPVGWLRV